MNVDEGAATNRPPTPSESVGFAGSPTTTVPGLPAVTGYKIMNNRRHVLTVDSNGLVELWDITSARILKSFGGGQTLDEIAKLLEEEVVVPSWFSVDISLGSVAVRLDRTSCFNAEIYAVDAGLQCDNEDTKVNIGAHMLDALFATWVTKRNFQRLAEPPALPPYVLERPVPVVISEEGSPVPLHRVMTDRFTGSEQLPPWAEDFLGEDRARPAVQVTKMSFQLQPGEGSGLPPLELPKLTAAKVMRTRKILAYIAKELKSEVDERNKEIKGPLPVETELEVVCNGRVVPDDMSLSAIRHFIWRSPEDLELAYRRKPSVVD
eukprot:Plantae.Rhodophyta-Rhodochaete_pulchella.ctg10324.p1 GENE.Plantae.Rhodophyta-Rhodochaete_pulchella.ctg10324~~Plantae.Rhodophyta-Rhodochaete_pulchella.ctg10324.p1  ORF type:complete len:348 (-),score=49.90 Plantae.Rhodophyta-Rhodochaete_pulchella.ctg10324:629-1591(-)